LRQRNGQLGQEGALDKEGLVQEAVLMLATFTSVGVCASATQGKAGWNGGEPKVFSLCRRMSQDSIKKGFCLFSLSLNIKNIKLILYF
jgi:hypothetical protein